MAMALATPNPLFALIAPEASGMPLYRSVRRALLQAIEVGALAPWPPTGRLRACSAWHRARP